MEQKKGMVVTDLDGTLLYEGNHITSQNYETISNARRRGWIYVVATGRCEGLLPKSILPEMDYSITSNGSRLVDEHTGNVLFANYITVENCLEALKRIRPYGPFMEIFAEGTVVLERDTAVHLERYQVPGFHREYFAENRHMVVEHFEDWLLEARPKVTKINMPCRVAGQLDALRADLESIRKFNLASDGLGIELTNSGVDKGSTLQWLCRRLEIPARQVAAFGDGANDAEMLEWAGYGVVMENGGEKARRAAGYTTGTNRESGVACFLEELLTRES